jgi:endonuclease VIII
MPEGDTIHRTAATLRAALVGRTLVRVELPRRPPPHPGVGATVERVEARGKHLLIGCSDGLTVHTHQRMTGSWHLYRPGERWQRPPGSARVVLGVEGRVAVCFAAPIVEVLDAGALTRHPVLRQLGPDLCEPTVDLDEVVARMGQRCPPDEPIGEVLLDQRVACGVGNVYRCDVLFLHGLHPTTPLSAVGPATRRELVATAADLLRRNLTGGARTTTGGPAGSLWVYGRAGRPCRRCGTAIERGRLGAQARVVDHCPRCQPAPPATRTGATLGT